MPSEFTIDWSTKRKSQDSRCSRSLNKQFAQVKSIPEKKVFEVRSAIGRDKGIMAEALLDHMKGLHLDSEVMPIYVGDDTTDEDANAGKCF